MLREEKRSADIERLCLVQATLFWFLLRTYRVKEVSTITLNQIGKYPELEAWTRNMAPKYYPERELPNLITNDTSYGSLMINQNQQQTHIYWYIEKNALISLLVVKSPVQQPPNLPLVKHDVVSSILSLPLQLVYTPQSLLQQLSPKLV